MKKAKSVSILFFIKAIVICAALILSNALNIVFSDTAKSVDIKIHVTDNGLTSVSQRFVAVSLNNTYEKISKGDFTQEDLKSAAWQSYVDGTTNKNATINTNGNGNQLTITGLSFGSGITNSKTQTLKIIQNLLENGHLDLVEELEGAKYGPGQGNGFGNITSFYSLGNVSKQVTNNQGVAENTVPSGCVAIISATNYTKILSGQITLLKIDYLSDNTQYNLDTQNTNPDLTVNLSNMTESSKVYNREYTVETNQELNYEVKINKSLASSGGTLALTLPYNLIIDDSSLSLLNSPVENNSSNLTDTTLTQPVDGQTNVWTAQIPASSDDLTIKIKAHLAAKRSYSSGVSAVTNKGNLNDKYSVSASYILASGETVAAQSPYVDITGQNFVMTDVKNNKMVSGYSYLLGKEVGNKTYLYDKNGGWTETSNVNTANSSDFTLIKGGYKYAPGFTSPEPIEFPNTSNGYPRADANKVAQSLIKIVGLSKGTQYFLYQVEAPKNGKVNHFKYEFSPNRETKFDTTGSSFVKASYNNLDSNQAIEFNSQIIDYKAGVMEYSYLPVSEGKTPSSHGLYIIIMIAVGAIVVTAIGIIVLKKTK